MLTHIVLFRPRPDLSPSDITALIEGIERAAREIPEVRRFTVGRLTSNPPAYLAGAATEFPFAAIVEVDDRAALDAYLSHPAHVALGTAFNASLASALICDYETMDARAGIAALLGQGFLDKRGLPDRPGFPDKSG